MWDRGFKMISETFLSSNNMSKVRVYIYDECPMDEIKGILQISHGMCEYLDRYKDFIEFMVANGFIVCGHDHIGHGQSVIDNSELGFFNNKNGFDNLVDDLITVRGKICEKYKDKSVYLLAHSMGSLIGRIALSETVYNGAIVSATADKKLGLGFGSFLSWVISKTHPNKYRSKLLNKLVFLGFNKTYNERRNKFDWLSRDNQVTDKYKDDPKCNFIFTASAFNDLINLTILANKDSVINANKTPLLFLAGADDPVGNYSKGVLNVARRYKKASKVDYKIYEMARHEILNEVNKEEVYNDILGFITSCNNY